MIRVLPTSDSEVAVEDHYAHFISTIAIFGGHARAESAIAQAAYLTTKRLAHRRSNECAGFMQPPSVNF